uniref:Uncharacterized protein n=1 Tax=Lepeophtheirus salmonis TaxID=72036 RepID=A0A0K2VC92_LEPSM
MMKEMVLVVVVAAAGVQGRLLLQRDGDFLNVHQSVEVSNKFWNGIEGYTEFLLWYIEASGFLLQMNALFFLALPLAQEGHWFDPHDAFYNEQRLLYSSPFGH